MDDAKVIEEARKYLKFSHPEEESECWSDERVLKTVNRVYFGGIQAFAKHVKKQG